MIANQIITYIKLTIKTLNMKTIAYILCLAVFVTACTKTPQTIAEKEVKSF